MSLHVLLHMAEIYKPVTSEILGQWMGANPVVIRRTLGGLRKVGLVRSGKGHGGGWQIARPLEKITLLDVYRGLSEPVLFQQHRGASKPGCLVAETVGGTLEDAFQEANQLIRARFEKIKLSDLSKEFHSRLERLKRSGGKHGH